MQHTLTCLVENQFGVLARVAGLISARAFNIDSLAVGECEDPTVSRMTIVVEGDERTLEQVKKQLNRLVDVIKVQDLTAETFIDRELILIKVRVSAKTRPELIQIAGAFEGRVVDVGNRMLTLEAAGDQAKIKGFLEILKPFGIVEVVRTGRVAMSREGSAAAAPAGGGGGRAASPGGRAKART